MTSQNHLVCPYCNVTIHEPKEPHQIFLNKDSSGGRVNLLTGTSYYQVGVKYFLCPNCEKPIVVVIENSFIQFPLEPEPRKQKIEKHIVYPPTSTRPVPPEVPKELADDFIEASRVLQISPKASAALSRRCLQNFLRDILKVKPGKLSNEIQEAIDSGKLNSDITDHLNTIREIGNYAAHPNKDENTDQIVDVEPNEAEYNLDILEDLFDTCIVKPIRRMKNKEKWNKKIKESKGKEKDKT